MWWVLSQMVRSKEEIEEMSGNSKLIVVGAVALVIMLLVLGNAFL